jgi:hypothetical protein
MSVSRFESLKKLALIPPVEAPVFIKYAHTHSFHYLPQYPA